MAQRPTRPRAPVVIRAWTAATASSRHRRHHAIRLRFPSERTGCEIYGKAEFLERGGSVKDRAALRDAVSVEGVVGHEATGMIPILARSRMPI